MRGVHDSVDGLRLICLLWPLCLVWRERRVGVGEEMVGDKVGKWITAV